MNVALLLDIVILFGLSVVVTLLFQKIKLPTLLGYLMTGIIAGPYGLSLIKATEEVDSLAEIGIIFLLFLIGIEFSLKQLISIRRSIFLGGSVQVLTTIAITFLTYYFFSYDWKEAVFMGFLFSLSSTAIVLKILANKGEMHTPQGRIALAILIFQDLLVVPMMLAIPLLAGTTDNTFMSLVDLSWKLIVVLLLVFVGARYLVPKLLFEVAKTRSQDLFILTTLLICFAIALLCYSIGLSLALGAFLAGLIISESEYSHQATGNITPFREIFTCFFFVSIGMLLDVSFLIAHLPFILGLTVVVIFAKFLAALLAAFALRFPPRIMFKAGLTLFQVGEFAFILSRSGIEYNLLDATTNQYFLSISILTMAITPIVMNQSERISKFVTHLFIPKIIRKRLKKLSPKVVQEPVSSKLKNHLIIIGFGINGQNLCKASKYAGIPYIIIEFNAETVKRETAKGEPIIYGDAMQVNILEHACLVSARAVVIAISDIKATENVLASIRRLNKSIYVIVRTHTLLEMEPFLSLGANEVIPEEFETSVEIFTRIMNKFLVPKNQIEEFVKDIRSEAYEVMRPSQTEYSKDKVTLPPFDIVCIKVESDKNTIVDRTLSESNIRSKYGIQILAIQRDKKVISHVDVNTVIKLHDSLFVSGDTDAINQFSIEISR